MIHRTSRLGRALVSGLTAVLLAVVALVATPATAAQANEGAGWNDWRNPYSIVDTPSFVEFNNGGGVRRYGAITISDGTMRFTTDGGSMWYTFPTPFTTPYGPTVAFYGNRMHVFARGGAANDNHIYYNVLNGGGIGNQGTWDGWVRLPFQVTTVGVPSVVSMSGRLYVFYTGMNNRFYVTNYNGGGWTPPVEVPGNGSSASPPTAVAYPTGEIILFHRGTDDRVYTQLYDPLWNDGTGWRVLDGVHTTRRVAAAASSADPWAVELAVVNRDNQNYVSLMTLNHNNETLGWHVTYSQAMTGVAAPVLFALLGAYDIYVAVTTRNGLFWKQAY